jgi:hypothetical protein
MVAQLVNKSTTADLHATKMLIDVLKRVEQKAGSARQHGGTDGSALRGSHRGSRAGRYREGRVCRVHTYGTAGPRSGLTGALRQARASILVAARHQPTSNI